MESMLFEEAPWNVYDILDKIVRECKKFKSNCHEDYACPLKFPTFRVGHHVVFFFYGVAQDKQCGVGMFIKIKKKHYFKLWLDSGCSTFGSYSFFP